MDIYKLLSRSTKLSRNAKAGQSQQNLPSGGQNANPQLFGQSTARETSSGDKEEVTVLGKRKRGVQAAAAAVDLPPELDFFGEQRKSQDKPSHKHSHGDKNGHSGRGLAGTEHGQELARQQEEIDEQECRRILKLHKVKITVLVEATCEASSTSSKKKRSKKKELDVKGKVPSKHKHQIYPQPLTSFAQLRTKYGISKRLAENIAHQGYDTPTEVQLAAFPLHMGDSTVPASGQKHDRDEDCQVSGFDLLTVAPTGSGKTLAFLIPVLNALLKDRRAGKDGGPQAVIIAPTRELASQIVNEGRKLAESTGMRISLVRKGMKIGGQMGEDIANDGHDLDEAEESNSDGSDDDTPYQINRKTRSPIVVKSHILVSTPLTFVHALTGENGVATTLPNVRHLVLDEADVLLDPLFREQTLSIWEACSNPDMRTSLWSATMSSSIEALALEYISKNKTLAHYRAPVLRLVVGLKDTALPNVTHTLTYAATEAGKLLALRQLLHPTAPDTDAEGRKALRPPFLIFTQTIERTKALHAELRYDIPPEAGGSSRIAALHSDMSETARGKVMTAFRRGEIWVIITTDLLARGVDFRGLNGVVNFDVPTSAAAYIHRVGRTGRAGREGGVAVTFYTKEDVPYIKPIANVIAASEKMKGVENVSGSTVQQWLLDALPKPSKKDKQELKKKGVEARRAGVKTARISTKSGFDRRMQARKGDYSGKSRAERARPASTAEIEEFQGFSD